MSDTTLDYRAVTARMQTTWALGDFNELGRQILPVSEAICDAVALLPGERVLDVACGSGNAALAAARRYCHVTGLDFVPSLVERANVRAAAEGTPIDFQVGDAQALPFPDASFDVVLSVFGVMFAPDQLLAASELTRVCRPGGRIGVACWVPDSFAGGFFDAVSQYLPPPPGLDRSTRWGTEAFLEQAFRGRTRSVRNERRVVAQYFLSVDHGFEVVRAHLGPVHRAFQLVDPSLHEALRRDVRAVLARYNRATDGTLKLECEYLETVIERA